MDKFLKLVNSLPAEQKDIFYKYMAVISVCKNNIDEKLEFLESKRITLNTAMALVRVLSMDIQSLKTRFKLYQESGLEDIVIMCPEILRYSPSKIISRIKACEKVGKAFFVNGKPASYVFDDQQWETVKNVFESDDKEMPALSQESPDDYIRDESYDLDVLAFERYERLSRLLENVRMAIGAPIDNYSTGLPSDEYLMKAVGTDRDKSDKDILKGCLKVCYGQTEGIDEIIDQFLYIDEDKGEKRGL